MKIKLQWSMREAYLLDKLEQKTIGQVRKLLTKTKAKLKNIMDKLKATTITAEQYDEIWGSLEDKLDDLYCNNPDAHDLENYEFELDGSEILIDEMVMGYDHNDTAKSILNLLVEKNIIKLKS